MRFCFSSFLVAALLALSAAPVAAQQAAPRDSAQAGPLEVADEIAAVVGNDVILRSEVDGLVATILQQQGASAPAYSKDLWMNALGELINQQVLVEAAGRDTTVKVSEAEVQQGLDRRVNQIVQRAGGEEEVERLYGKSILQLKEDFSDDFREQLLAERFRTRRVNEVDVTPSEVRQWFEQIPADSLPTLPDVVRLAHIVRYPKPSESARQLALNVITNIRDSVLAGVPLEDMARRFSDDPGSASNGGRYASLPLANLEPEFAAVASRIPIGEISQPFQTSRGYHILRVNERTGGTVDFNHVLITVDDRNADPAEAIATLNAVRDSLLENPNLPFALMARRHSEEVSSKQNGGRVVDPQSGTRDLVLSALGPTWTRTLRGMEEGEISEPAPVELLDGESAYHIVKLQRRVPRHRVNLETDYERIKEYALREKQQRVLQEWINDLRAQTFVDVRLTRDDLAAAR